MAVCLAALALVVAGCSSSPKSSNGATTPLTQRSAAAITYAVGQMQQTYVDTSRTTPAWGPNPARGSRTLSTTVLYPASASGTTPDRSNAPYPIVMFSHGLGASLKLYMPLLRKLAAAGFVVAAPRFPLSNSETPGGPDAGDVVNQPGDISYVLTQVLRAANENNGTLAGLVNPDEVGVAGHSNGAITTLGLAANTCCRDTRAKAAVVMAGTTESYPGGRYDFTNAPPILIVHGTNDALIPYNEGVAVFNRARGPKGLLTVRNGDHGSAAAITGASASVIVRTVVDFLDSALRGGSATGGRLVDAAKSSATSLKYVAQPGSTETIPTVPTPKANLHAAVNPSRNLSAGQKVTVTWSGYTPGKVVNVLQCSASDRDLSNSAGCDFSQAAVLHPDPTGAGSLQLEIVEGKVGNSVCDATHQGCFIVVNNASSPDPAASVKLPITFAS